MLQRLLFHIRDRVLLAHQCPVQQKAWPLCPKPSWQNPPVYRIEPRRINPTNTAGKNECC
jgi:hypothetical protein